MQSIYRYRNEFGMHSIPGVAPGKLSGSTGAQLDDRPAYVVPVSKLYNAWHLLQSLIPAYVLLKRWYLHCLHTPTPLPV